MQKQRGRRQIQAQRTDVVDQQRFHRRVLGFLGLVIADERPGAAAGDFKKQQLAQQRGGEHQTGHRDDKNQQECVVAIAAIVRVFLIATGQISRGVKRHQQTEEDHHKQNQGADFVYRHPEQRYLSGAKQRDIYNLAA